MLKKVLMAGALCALALAAVVHPAMATNTNVAGMLGLNNTGETYSNSSYTPDIQGNQDKNYTLQTLDTSSWTWQLVTNPYVTELSQGQFPSTYWTASVNDAQWISPQSNYTQNNSDAAGFYLYTTQFTPTAGTYQITGNWATDNYGVGVYLDGALITNSAMNGSYTTLSIKDLISSDFTKIQSWADGQKPQDFSKTFTYSFDASGNNPHDLAFLVYNASGSGGNPTGVIANFSAQPIPEPEFFQLGTLLACGGFLGLFRKMRKASNSLA